MKSHPFHKATLFIAGALMMSLVAQPASAASRFEPDAPNAPDTIEMALTTPDTVVDADVGTYDMAPPKIFWTDMLRDCPAEFGATKNFTDMIKRVAAQGSEVRTIFERYYANVANCTSKITSNLAADSSNVFWASDAGVLSLPATAMTTTLPTTMTMQVNGNVELVLAGAYLYALTPSNGLWQITKPNGGATRIITAANIGASPKNLKTDGIYLYWITGGTLKRYNISSGDITQIGGSGVTGYTPNFALCFGCPNPPPAGVFVAYTNVIKRYNISTGALINANIYTSGEATAYIKELIAGGQNLFWFEDRQTGPADPFPPVSTFILRKKGDGTGTTALLYTSGSGIEGPAQQLKSHDSYIYWQENYKILRLPFDASALPLTNMKITSMEVTQGIQDLSNSVMLIQGKRTFVRMHVKSDGPSIAGITARLYRLNLLNQRVGEGLLPVNKAGEYLTVQAGPQREILDDSFPFELPMDWQNDIALRVQGELNPFHYPPESSYGDNTKTVISALFASPRLEMNFVLFNYTFAGKTYAADYFEDYLPTLSWLHRAYPLSNKQDYIENPGPGLHTHYFYMTDQELPKHLNYSSSDCPDDPKDDGGLCASDYINGVLEDIDDEDNNSASYYGFMPSLPGWFARGQTSGDTSNGPADDACSIDSGGNRNCGWDIDTTKADWYAAHEIGHQLGRHHPKPAGDPDTGDSVKVGCGHSADDGDYPYSGAKIGNGSLWGFDMGDTGVSKWLTMRVYPNSTWTDVMSYCDSEWISDYTYKGIYGNLSLMNSAMQAQAMGPQMVNVANADVLKVAGSINTTASDVKFVTVKRKPSGALSADVVNATHRLRLLDANGAVLSTLLFTPGPAGEVPNVLPFNLVVPFAAGTRKVEISNIAGNQVLGVYLISANAPVVSNVNYVAATSPIAGNFTLNWDASDADGDTLTYDVYYSKNNGATFMPVAMNVAQKSLVIDSALLPGSAQGVLKVVASDGANNASGLSPAVSIANKPPKVSITGPASGSTFAWGQLVNLFGIVEDEQTNGVPDAQIVWSNQFGVLGTGAQLPVTNLPIGINVITLTASSSTGLSASDSITIEVNDNLDIPGPTLTAGPDQVSWHFDIGENTTKQATVYISNAGSGTLNWNATFDAAPWLSLNVSSGSAPGSIVLTANPAGLGDVDSVSTVLHITSGNQKIDIPVTLSFGNSFNGNKLPQGNSKQKVFLPVVVR